MHLLRCIAINYNFTLDYFPLAKKRNMREIKWQKIKKGHSQMMVKYKLNSFSLRFPTSADQYPKERLLILHYFRHNPVIFACTFSLTALDFSFYVLCFFPILQESTPKAKL